MWLFPLMVETETIAVCPKTDVTRPKRNPKGDKFSERSQADSSVISEYAKKDPSFDN